MLLTEAAEPPRGPAAGFEILLNERLTGRDQHVFAGDYEVVGPEPWLGHPEVRALGVDLALLHFHHRHEFAGGQGRGLWGTVQQAPNRFSWNEVDALVEKAAATFPLVGLYPVGWAHMVPTALGRSILDLNPEVIADWVARVVARYHRQVAIFPVFYEMNVFDLFYRQTDGREYGVREKNHVVDILAACHATVTQRVGPRAASQLAAGTFVELTRSSFYWMSEGKLLELPRGSSLLGAALAPQDLLRTAAARDAERGGSATEAAVRQLLHQIVFWNADDAGSGNLVGDDLRRLVEHRWIYDRDLNPDGFAHLLIPGWDAQPHNTYEYLLARLAPDRYVPGSAEMLYRHYDSFSRFLGDRSVPRAYRNRVAGFVLDDIFKCRKQTGITSAVYPEESQERRGGLRAATGTVTVSALGDAFGNLTRRFAHRSVPDLPVAPATPPSPHP